MADVADQLGNDIPLQEIGGSRQNRVQNEPRVNGEKIGPLSTITYIGLVLGSVYQLEDAFDNLDVGVTFRSQWKAIGVIVASVLNIVLSGQLLV